LDHEAVNDAVESESIIETRFRKLYKIGTGLGCPFYGKADLKIAETGLKLGCDRAL